MDRNEYLIELINERGPEFAASVGSALQRLDMMSDDERRALFVCFCSYCGSSNPSCQCMNDE